MYPDSGARSSQSPPKVFVILLYLAKEHYLYMFIVVVRECYRCCEDVLKQRAQQGKESDILFEVQQKNHKHDGEGGEDNE